MKSLSSKNSVSFKSIAAILATGLFFSLNSYAESVEIAGQAIGLCKEQAKKAHPDYQQSKSMDIRQKPGIFIIKMKVVTESESIRIVCTVDKDGTITYAKA